MNWHTTKYLEFSSHHPLAHKIAAVRTLHTQVQALTSSPVARSQEEQTISQALIRNGYPISFSQRHSYPSQKQPSPSQAPTTTAHTTIPYIRGTSEAIRRIFSPLGIRTTFCPTNTLRRLLVHPKDPVPERERSCVIYRIPCTNCPRAYIGQTSRTLSQRVKEHQRSVRNSDIEWQSTLTPLDTPSNGMRQTQGSYNMKPPLWVKGVDNH